MKRLGFAGLMLVALLFAAQVASAQGWPGCPWAYSSYDPATHTLSRNTGVSQCTNVKPDAERKPMGLARPAPAAAQPLDPCGRSAGPDPWLCQSMDAAARAARLAAPVPAAALVPGSPCGVLIGPVYAPSYVACMNAYRDATSAAAKPAGLAAPAPIVDLVRGSPCGVLIGPIYAPSYVACMNAHRDATSAAAKPAGLARPAPAAVQPLDPCGRSAGLDPWLCQSMDAAARAARLAAPVPATALVPGSACGVLTGLDPCGRSAGLDPRLCQR
jgi:hypothetical protein